MAIMVLQPCGARRAQRAALSAWQGHSCVQVSAWQQAGAQTRRPRRPTQAARPQGAWSQDPCPSPAARGSPPWSCRCPCAAWHKAAPARTTGRAGGGGGVPESLQCLGGPPGACHAWVDPLGPAATHNVLPGLHARRAPLLWRLVGARNAARPQRLLDLHSPAGQRGVDAAAARQPAVTRGAGRHTRISRAPARAAGPAPAPGGGARPRAGPPRPPRRGPPPTPPPPATVARLPTRAAAAPPPPGPLSSRAGRSQGNGSPHKRRRIGSCPFEAAPWGCPRMAAPWWRPPRTPRPAPLGAAGGVASPGRLLLACGAAGRGGHGSGVAARTRRDGGRGDCCMAGRRGALPARLAGWQHTSFSAGISSFLSQSLQAAPGRVRLWGLRGCAAARRAGAHQAPFPSETPCSAIAPQVRCAAELLVLCCRLPAGARLVLRRRDTPSSISPRQRQPSCPICALSLLTHPSQSTSYLTVPATALRGPVIAKSKRHGIGRPRTQLGRAATSETSI